MKYRALGNSSLKLSEIGFGCWGIGGRTLGETSYGETNDQESLEALNKALEVGINFFDTSNVYGAGKSEELIGSVATDHRDEMIIATKAGWNDYSGKNDYSPSAITASLEASLRRLQTEYIDLLQLHNPPIDDLETHPEIVENLENLKKHGKMREWGFSIKNPMDGLKILERYNPASLQVNFNMLDDRALSCGLLEKAREKGVGIISRTPLCFGFLSGDIDETTTFSPGDHRLAWSVSLKKIWAQSARKIKAQHPLQQGETMIQSALRFCLSFSGVASTIPGMLKADEVVENAKASLQGPLPPSVLASITKINEAVAADFQQVKP
ncbi:MAG: aldo/keto reductase [Rhodospirillales bacterium]|nr:aldo/keto reductase [Rhodospirillales bacterium]